MKRLGLLLALALAALQLYGCNDDFPELEEEARALRDEAAACSPGVSKNGGLGIVGPYRIPHVKVDSYAVYTNLPPAVPFRGLAVSQAAWAYESHLDTIARSLGIDPLELRARNLLRDGDHFATGEPMRNVHFVELVKDAAASLPPREPGPVPNGARMF